MNIAIHWLLATVYSAASTANLRGYDVFGAVFSGMFLVEGAYVVLTYRWKKRVEREDQA